MDYGLKHKAALVLASSRGLGRGIAEALAQEGARVALVGRSAERLSEAARAISGRGGAAVPIVADLGEPGAPRRIFDAAVKALGSIEVLVNNSGGPPPGAPSEIAAEDWTREFGKMVLPLFDLTRLALPDMRARGWGRIVTVVSSGVVEPIPNLPISNALRLAIVGWMKSLAGEVAAQGITVNLVAPGRIDTDRVREIDAGAAKRTRRPVEEVQRESMAAIPAGRYGRVEEFAAAAAFLASSQASYVTGSILRVDGGMLRSL